MSSMPPMLPPVPDLGPTFGVAYIAVVISAMLYGVTCLQTFIYFINSRTDPIWTKLLVLTTLLIDTLHEAFLLYAGYYYFIQNYFNPIALESGMWCVQSSIIAHMFVNGVAAFLVESFMIWRLHFLSNRNYFLTVPAMILVLAHLGVDFAWPIQAFIGPNLSFERIKSLTPTAVSGFVIGSVTDVYITGSLAYYLWSSRTGFKKSNDMIYRLIQYIITTGLLTTVDNIISLAVYVARPENFYYMFFSFILAKLYINSLLATLNSRQSIRETGGTDVMSMSRLAGSQTVAASNNTMRVHVSTMKFAESFKEPERGETPLDESYKRPVAY
ncbi:hypothetical protein CVT26_010197 [Gymnopilus dilepis]|uniref:DUF6534 domain-containing protein n=1 Tax=Gymnopilus dilepis TaxID=231916 RepID=A0A409WCZ7_9AGAR|nr:hypothetical protein CVT26_010197 [Gymnopilus dilepis]